MHNFHMSIRYQDKETVELRDIIRKFMSRSNNLEPHELSKMLKDLAEKKDKEAFFSAFEQLSAKNLREAAEMLFEPDEGLEREVSKNIIRAKKK